MKYKDVSGRGKSEDLWKQGQMVQIFASHSCLPESIYIRRVIEDPEEQANSSKGDKPAFVLSSPGASTMGS